MRYFLIVFLFLAPLTVPAQPLRAGGNGERLIVTTPMIGAGTWDDPRRPALAREANAPFRFHVSDDGKSAIVEISPRGPLEAERIEKHFKTDSRTKVFRPGKDKQADVDNELKKLKKDFDLANGGKAVPAVPPGRN